MGKRRMDDSRESDGNELCVKCIQTVRSDQCALQCDDCERWQHLSCSTLLKSTYDALRDDASDHVGFFCSACVARRRRDRLAKKRRISQSSNLNAARAQPAVTQSASNPPTTLKDVPNQPVPSAKPSTSKPFNAVVSSKAPPAKPNPTRLESLTIICSNVPEADSPCFKTRQAADQAQWQAICKSMNVNVVPENMVRLTRPPQSPHAGEPRLLRITLRSIADTESVLLSAYLLRNTSSAIRITPDTPWSERRARKQDDFDWKSDIDAKSIFIHGIPEARQQQENDGSMHDGEQWRFVQQQAKIENCLTTGLKRLPFAPSYKGNGPRILKVTFHSVVMMQHALDSWYQNRRYVPQEIRLRPAIRSSRNTSHTVSVSTAPPQPPSNPDPAPTPQAAATTSAPNAPKNPSQPVPLGSAE